MNSEMLLKDQYYNLGELPKLLRISKKTFYQIRKWSNFPKVIALTATFKVVLKTEMNEFATWYQDYRRQDEKTVWINNLLSSID